jgi:hypothetical protein
VRELREHDDRQEKYERDREYGHDHFPPLKRENRTMDLRKVFLFLMAASVAGCDQPQQPNAPSRTPAAAPAVESREIYVDEVTSANPLIVRGRARTFENTVSIRVRDAKGDLIREVHTTSVGEMGHHNPFEAQVFLTRDPGTRITVDAFEYSAKDGSVRSLASRSIDFTTEMMKVHVAFPTSDCDRLATFTREVPKTTSIARLLVEMLVAGPTASENGATSPFPQGSAVRSVILRNGELTVDFNERLQNVGGSCAAIAIRNAVTQTLKQLPSVKSVVITAGGSRDLALQP